MIFCMGSSPHTRGTPPRPRSSSTTAWDHPRIRGEHCASCSSCAPIQGIIPAYAGNTSAACRSWSRQSGSSPHTRGTRYHGASNEAVGGIIPAYAGNTFACVFAFAALAGSSPHTRGTRTCSQSTVFWPGDHPRIRGEHFIRYARL